MKHGHAINSLLGYVTEWVAQDVRMGTVIN